MAELSIKNFPDDLMHELKTVALAHKMTLKEFVTQKLEELVTKKK